VQAVNKYTAQQSQVMKEILDSVRIVRLFNGVGAAMLQFMNTLQRRYRQDAYVNYVNMGFQCLLQVVTSAFGLLLMLFSSRMIVGSGQIFPFTGRISYGNYWAFKTYADSLKDSLVSLAGIYAKAVAILTVAQVLCVFFYRKPAAGCERAQGPGVRLHGAALHCSIRFENVKFSYPSRPTAPVLNGFTAAFPAGKFTCVIGNSGSGKSTLLMLMLRM